MSLTLSIINTFAGALDADRAVSVPRRFVDTEYNLMYISKNITVHLSHPDGSDGSEVSVDTSTSLTEIFLIFSPSS
jgi:hypothetical protein